LGNDQLLSGSYIKGYWFKDGWHFILTLKPRKKISFMKVQCPSCKFLVHINVQQFLKLEELSCSKCGRKILLPNTQERPVSFQFFLTDAGRN